MLRKKFKIYLSQAALDDLYYLTEFYKKLMFRLAKNLIIEMNEAFGRLQTNPGTFAEGYNGKFGIITLRKYPVEIYYTIDQHDIIVLSIEHKNQHPNKWIDRV